MAFGVPEEEIDDKKLWYALKEAQLDEFVKTLPEGINTGIGERGIRLFWRTAPTNRHCKGAL